ncbi:leucine-rich repeat domain-containing protein [Singulisphaera rosea]
MIDPSPRRTWRQNLRPFLTLRGQMVVIGALAIWMGWFIHKVNVQRESITAIYRAGGSVHYDSDFDIGNGPKRRVLAPRWLVKSLGIDFFSSIDRLSFHKTGADELAGYLAKLPKLKTVDFSKSDLSDSGLARLRGLDLHFLILCETKVTDAGIRHIRNMNNLNTLYLDRTSVGDDAMAGLATLPMLEVLMVSETQVGDLGVRSIAKLPALKVVNLVRSQVGDAGAVMLKSMPGLRPLDIYGSYVTPKMMKQLYPSFYGVSSPPGA